MKKSKKSKLNQQQKKLYRNTRQRIKILQLIESCPIHPTAYWIHKKLKKKFKGVTIGRVYRNLRVLKEEGKIWELDFGTGVSCFAAVKHPHYHFVCNHCQKIYDIKITPLKEIEDKIAQLTGFRILSHRLEFFGLCDKCKMKKAVKQSDDLAKKEN